MTRERKGKQKTRRRIRGEILERIPDAEERFQEAFDKLTKRTRKQIEKKSARALEAKRKFKGMQARGIHKKPREVRRKFHEAKFQEQEANRHKFAYELLAEKAEVEIIRVESASILDSLADKFYNRQAESYKQIHGRVRPRKRGISKKEVKNQIIAPFRRLLEEDDVLLTLQWNIPGGMKEYSRLLKKHGMFPISSNEDEGVQFESYMIYNMKSRVMKYDSLVSELFKETTMEITPKEPHHSDLVIPLDEIKWTENVYDCWGKNILFQRGFYLNGSLTLWCSNGYVDSFHKDTIDGLIEFKLEEIVVPAGAGDPSWRTYLTFVGKDGTRPAFPNRRADPFISTIAVSPEKHDRIIGGWVRVEDGYTDHNPVQYNFSFGVGVGIGDVVDLSVSVEADADNENIDTFELAVSTPNELILHNYETRSYDLFKIGIPIAGHFTNTGKIRFQFDIQPSFVDDNSEDDSEETEIGMVCFNIPVQYGSWEWVYMGQGNYHFHSEIIGLWDVFDSAESTIHYIRGDAVKGPSIAFQPSSPIPIEYHPPDPPDQSVKHVLTVQLTNNSELPLSKVFLLSVAGYNRSGIIFVPSTSDSSQEWETDDDKPSLKTGETMDFTFEFTTEGVGDAYPIFHIQYSFDGVPGIISFPIGRDFEEFIGPAFIVSPRAVENLQVTQIEILNRQVAKLTWASNTLAAYAPQEPGIYYRVFRNGELIAQLDDNDSVADMQYIDEDVDIGSEYSYQVSVVAHFVESEPSEPVQEGELAPESELLAVTTAMPLAPRADAPTTVLGQRESKLSDEIQIRIESPPEDVIPPDRVTDVVASLSIIKDELCVDLHWNPNKEPDLKHYNIVRDNELIKSVSKTNYLDSKVESWNTYSYKVSATDLSDNEGRPSTTIKVTPGIVGNKNTREFHLPYCVHASRIKTQNQVRLSSVKEAKAMDYNGCHWCLRGYDTG